MKNRVEGRGFRVQERKYFLVTVSCFLLLLQFGCGQRNEPEGKIRVAHFPNVLHAQAIVGLEKQFFQNELSGVTVETKLFTAGPSEIEALLAGEIDLGYVGPGPAINGFLRSHGKALRVIAGSSSGGALFVIHPNSGIRDIQDLNEKILAVPGIANTQDISLRHYLKEQGLKTKEIGGTVQLLAIENSNILSLFLRNELDGAWVPEPWGTRILLEAKGKVFLDERNLWPDRKFPTTVLIARKKFMDQHSDWVLRWVRAHLKTTEWIQRNPQEAKEIVHRQISAFVHQEIPRELIEQAWDRFDVTGDVIEPALVEMARRAKELKFIEDDKIEGLIDRFFLDHANR